MKHHKLKERLEAVAVAMGEEATPELQTALDILDHEKGRYITAAIKRFNRGLHDDPWSSSAVLG